MRQRAAISRHYHIRILAIGLGALIFGLFFVKDGWQKYPEQQRVYQEFQNIREKNPENYNEAWYQKAQEEGLPERPVERTDSDILTQKIIAFILVPLGVVVLIRFLLNTRRWIEMDDDGLRDQSGRQVAWDRITSLDKSRWQNKGIAVVHYTSPDGRPGRMVLDDWKFDREPIKQIVERVEQVTEEEGDGSRKAEESPEADPV